MSSIPSSSPSLAELLHRIACGRLNAWNFIQGLIEDLDEIADADDAPESVRRAAETARSTLADARSDLENSIKTFDDAITHANNVVPDTEEM